MNADSGPCGRNQRSGNVTRLHNYGPNMHISQNRIPTRTHRLSVYIIHSSWQLRLQLNPHTAYSVHEGMGLEVEHTAH